MATGGATTTADITPMDTQPKEDISDTVKLKHWRGVALWKYETETDICGICRSPLMEPCIHCQATANVGDTIDCQVAWGVCGHTYHLDCISRWVVTRNICPMDQGNWELSRIGR